MQDEQHSARTPAGQLRQEDNACNPGCRRRTRAQSCCASHTQRTDKDWIKMRAVVLPPASRKLPSGGVCYAQSHYSQSAVDASLTCCVACRHRSTAQVHLHAGGHRTRPAARVACGLCRIGQLEGTGTRHSQWRRWHVKLGSPDSVIATHPATGLGHADCHFPMEAAGRSKMARAHTEWWVSGRALPLVLAVAQRLRACVQQRPGRPMGA